MRVLILLALLACVAAQRNNRAQAQSSVTVSASSSEDLQSQLDAAAQEALSALADDPDNLNNVLQQLGNVLLTQIGSIIVSGADQGDLDAQAIASQISEAVGGAISVAVSSGTTFAGLDVDSITSEISSNVESALSGAGAQADTTELTIEVANIVLNAVGNALAEETGATFSFQLSVSSSQTSGSSTSGSVTVGGQSAAEFEASFASQTEQALATLEANPDDINNVMAQVAQVLLTSITSLLQSIQTSADIDAQALSVVISTAMKNVLTSVVSSSTTFADVDVDGISASLQSDLESIFTEASSGQLNITALTTQVANSVISVVGNALAEAAGVTFSFTISVEGGAAAPATTTTSSSTTTVTVQGTAELESELQAALEQALANLESSPGDLNTVFQSIGTVLLTVIGNIVTTIFSGGEIDAQGISATITSSIEKALTAAAASSAEFESIDVAGISAEISSSLETIFAGVDAGDADAGELTVQIANAVLSPIGNAISDITGGSFTFTVSLGDAPTPAPTAMTSSTTQTISIQATDELESQLQASLEKALAELESNPDDLNVVFQSIGSVLITILGNIITTIINGGEIDADAISQTIAGSIESALTTAAASSTEFEDLDVAAITAQITTSLESILGDVNVNTANAGDLTVEIANAVLGPIGDNLSEITGTTFSFTISLDATPGASSTTTTTSTTQNAQLQMSVNIISNISNTQQATELIKSAAENNQDMAISAAFIQALQAGQTEDLSKLVTNFVTDSDIRTSTITFVLTTTILQGGAPAIQLVIDSIGSTEDLTNLAAVFKFAFTSTGSNESDAFVQLVAGSVEGDDCGLADVVAAALEDSTPQQVRQITNLLEDAGAEACVPSSTPEPTEPAEDAPEEPVQPTNEDAEPPTDPTAPAPAEGAPATSSSTSASASVSVTGSATTEVVSAPATEGATVTVTGSTAPSSPSDVEAAVDEAMSTIASSVTQASSVSTQGTEEAAATTSPPTAIEGETEAAPSPSPSTTPAPTPAADGACTDVAPPGGYSCDQQAKFGKCERQWMKDGNFCAKTCGFCGEACTDTPPDDRYTCAQQKDFGKCESSWMKEGGFCQATCGFCGEGATPAPASTPAPNPSPTPAPTASPAPGPTPAVSGEGACNCDCGCCGDCSCTGMDEEAIAKMVKDVVDQVLSELNA
eukprot:TRINITY_DN5689_c0_g1_i1.p1 TRINITY_DN5689_c0_g1~~TRINITY_DN5689_c0_g1_i1.p1  ORF type:complete len:1210 (-),score=229.99 TRINITY_DN5689_c0_g1_i1:891-4403(-)